MELNIGKCYLLLSFQRPIKIGNWCINSSSCGRLLGSNLDEKPKVGKDVNDICQKV